MSNTPDNNENKLELEQESEIEQIPEPEQESEQEESTIFAAPSLKDDGKVKVKNKKRNIIVSVAVVLILSVVITAVAIFIPTLTDDTSSDPSRAITLTSFDSDDVDKVTVKNESGEYGYYSRVELTEIDNESVRYVYWHINSVAERLADSDKIEELVSNLTSLAAVREMGEDVGVYGLDTPRYKIEVFSRDNAFTDYTVTVGNQSPDKTGAYVMLSNNDTVYLVDNSYIEEYAKVPTDYADTTAVKAVEETDTLADYFEDGTLSTCDYIKLNNPQFSSPITIVPNDIEGSKTYATFRITSPIARFAENANELLNIAANGLVGDGVYVFNPTDADIKAYKLDNPTATLEIKIGDTVILLKAAKAEADYYALIDQDKEAIYKVYYNSLQFAENQMSHYYNKFLTMEMLPNLSKVTIKVPENTYEFSVTYYEELEDGEDFDIVLNGEELNQTAFQNYYQVFLSVEVIDYSTHNITSDPVYSFKMEHSDKSIADTELKLYKHTDQRYIATVNGEQMGLISATSYNKLTSYLEKLLNGEEVPKS